MNIDLYDVIIWVYLWQLSYKDSHLSHRKHEMEANTYYFMIYVPTEYSMRSQKWIFAKKYSAHWLIWVCLLICVYHEVSSDNPYELNMKECTIHLSTGYTMD